MKRTVTKLLNIRNGSPDTNAASAGFLSPGDTIDVAEVVRGAKLHRNEVWFKLTDGTFVWSGGTNDDGATRFAVSMPLSASNNLGDLLVLPAPAKSNGAGMVIGICDSGIDVSHPALEASLLQEDNCLLIPHTEKIVNGHGTGVAGILTGNDLVVTGLAIDARIRSFRMVGDGDAVDELGLKNALEKILNDNIHLDVLNLSLTVSNGSVPFFQPLISKIAERGTIVVVAGNDGSISALNNIAKLTNVLSVGVFNAGADFNQLKVSWFPGAIHVAYLNVPILTTALATFADGHTTMSSSSAYAAVTSGIIARFLGQQFLPLGNRQQAVIEYLNAVSFPIKNENQPVPLKPYKHV